MSAYIPMNPDLSLTLASHVDKHFPYPLLMLGGTGTGRTYSVLTAIKAHNCEANPRFDPFHYADSFPNDVHEEIIKANEAPSFQCSCLKCRKVDGSKTPDIAIINGYSCSIQEVRDVANTLSSKPAEMHHRYLIVQNVDFIAPEAMDVLLKIVEEPWAHLRIFMTASSLAAVRPAIQSRSLPVEVGTLSGNRILALVMGDPNLRIYRNTLGLYPFDSVTDLSIFARFNIGDMPVDMIKSSNLASLRAKVTAFLDLVNKEKDKYPPHLVYNVFLKYLNHWVLNALSKGDYDELRYSDLYHYYLQLQDVFSESLFATFGTPYKARNLSFYTNPSIVLFSYLSAVSYMFKLSGQ